MAKISYSAVSQFKSCPQRYYHSQNWRPRLNASALPFGAAIESACDALLEGKTLAHSLEVFKAQWLVRPKNRFEEETEIFDSPSIFYYMSDFDANLLTDIDYKMTDSWGEEFIGEGFKDTDEEMSTLSSYIKNNQTLNANQRLFYHRVLWLCCRRRGIWMIKAFKEQILPKVTKVIAMQKEVKITNADGDVSTGYIDYILEMEGHDGPIIFDCKTAGRPYDFHALNTSDQLRSYSAAEGVRNIGYLVLLKAIKCDKLCGSCGAARENARLKNCEKCKKGKYSVAMPSPQTQVLVKTLNSKDVQDVMNDFSEILTAIKNKITYKNPTACFNFGKKCEYYDVCWGNKTIEQLKQEEETNGNRDEVG